MRSVDLVYFLVVHTLVALQLLCSRSSNVTPKAAGLGIDIDSFVLYMVSMNMPQATMFHMGKQPESQKNRPTVACFSSPVLATLAVDVTLA
jgi:hypothetical protein